MNYQEILQRKKLTNPGFEDFHKILREDFFIGFRHHETQQMRKREEPLGARREKCTW